MFVVVLAEEVQDTVLAVSDPELVAVPASGDAISLALSDEVTTLLLLKSDKRYLANTTVITR